MKDIIQEINQSQDKEVQIIQNKVEQVLLKRERVIPGCKLYECNLMTKEIIEANFTQNTCTLLSSSADVVKTKSLIVNRDCVYIQAINLSNATRKFEKKFQSLLKYIQKQNG